MRVHSHCLFLSKGFGAIVVSWEQTPLRRPLPNYCNKSWVIRATVVV